ncbi:MAG TPA: UbiA family prenyltransferase [Chthoniobacteraceae bacterium]
MTALLIKAARPGFWSTSVWFYLLPLGQKWVFDDWRFWLGLLYVTFPLGLLIYGCNDLVDRETDRLNPRKDSYLFGARPDEAQLARLPGWIALVQAPFFAGFVWMFGGKALVWIGVLLALIALYNLRPPALKSRAGWDMLNQVGYLLVFILASWLCDLPQAPWFTFVFGALFAMHSHLFGQIMDHAPDLAAGRRTTAGVLGIRRAKLLLIFLLLGESALVGWCATDLWTAAFLLAGAAFFVADAAFLWRNRPYEPWQMRLLFLGWNAAAIFSLPFVWQQASFAAR